MTESITHIEHRQPAAMSEYKIHLENLKRNITVLLDNGVNLSGNSKLFIVACRLECLKELLIQVWYSFVYLQISGCVSQYKQKEAVLHT